MGGKYRDGAFFVCLECGRILRDSRWDYYTDPKTRLQNMILWMVFGSTKARKQALVIDA